MEFNLSAITDRLKTLSIGDEGLSVFLILLFLTLFLAPFVDSLPVRLLTSLFFSLVMVAGVASMSRHPAVRSLAGLVAFAAIVLRWMMHVMPSPAVLQWGSLASLAFMVMLTVVILVKVFGDSGPVTGHRVRGAIAVYLMFGITWSILYGLIDQVFPHAFNLPEIGELGITDRQGRLIFFSFVTLTTVGYGDITPTHEITRMFAIMEALCGQLYPATLLARLVSLQLMHHGTK